MLLKYLLVSIIFYYIIKTSRNLVRAVRGELNPSRRDVRFDSPSSQRRERSGWAGQRTAPRRGDARHGDIEDAKWEDL